MFIITITSSTNSAVVATGKGRVKSSSRQCARRRQQVLQKRHQRQQSRKGRNCGDSLRVSVRFVVPYLSLSSHFRLDGEFLIGGMVMMEMRMGQTLTTDRIGDDDVNATS